MSVINIALSCGFGRLRIFKIVQAEIYSFAFLMSEEQEGELSSSQAHNLKVVGSNPTPATKKILYITVIYCN